MQIKLFIDKEKLEQKDTAKYLCVYFDSNLTWNIGTLERWTLKRQTASWIEGLTFCKKLEGFCKKKP